MKNKYVMIQGLAFCEQGDMDKLSDYAKKGWILDSIKGCIFYKFKKCDPQDIIYSVDYQYDTDDEYFSLFQEAGWKHIVTAEKCIHIFSAPKGTQPIYSDSESEISKYMPVEEKFKKYSMISGLLSLISLAMSIASSIYMKKLLLLFIILLTLSLSVFVASYMPYIAYASRIKLIKEKGKCIDSDSVTKKFYIVNLVAGLIIIPISIKMFKNEIILSLIYIIIAISNILVGLKFFKSKKK